MDKIIEKLPGGIKMSGLDSEINELKEKIQAGTQTDQKRAHLLEAIHSLRHRLARIESGPGAAADEKIVAARLTGVLNELTKKITRERDIRGEASPAQNNAVQNAAIAETKTQQKHFNGGEQKNADDRQSAPWNIGSLKANFDRDAQRAMASKTPEQPRFRENLDAIIDRARVVVTDSRNAAFSLKLHPRELGSVNIHLGLDQGVLQGRFLVETAEAKTLLMQILEQIRQELAQSGITVGEFQVDVSGQGKESRDGLFGDGEASPLIQAKEISAQFEINTEAAHNGSINMIV
jgi:flagellar hook-length control protein FliK